MEIFPNPTADFINIISAPLYNGTLCRIIDATAKTVASFKIAESNRIDVSQFPEGIYFLYSEDINIQQKIVIKR